MRNVLLSIALVIVIIFSTSVAFGQITNAGFENWANGNPVGWTTSNIVALGAVPITQSSRASDLSGVWADFLLQTFLSKDDHRWCDLDRVKGPSVRYRTDGDGYLQGGGVRFRALAPDGDVRVRSTRCPGDR